MAGEIVVQIEKRFPGGAEIRADFRLDLASEETTILFGPSGSGKTTVLRCLAGLERPDRGRIQFNDETWFDSSRGIFLPPRARSIGFLFQHYALFPHLTVRENVEYGLDGQRASERQRIAGEILRRFEIADLAERKPRQISGGQAQRVALARAIAPQPRLLLLDEPLAALDAPTRSRLRSELRHLLRDVRTPVLLVTHDRTEAIGLGQRLIVMAEGRVHQVGPVDEVFRHPANPQVAQTVGVESILQGTVLSQGNGILTVAIQGAAIRAAMREEFRDGDSVLVCIRAEEVALQQMAASGESTRNHFSGTVISIESDGAVERIALDCGFPLASIVTRSAREELRLMPGSPITAAIKATAVHLVRP
jgi:molybdate transport system ATP-binding protein